MKEKITVKNALTKEDRLSNPYASIAISMMSTTET